MNSVLMRVRALTGAQVAIVLLLCLLALIGGASRGGEPAQILVRLAAVAALAFAIYTRPAPFDLATRPVAVALAAAVAAIAIQLIPLPFSIWSALPGRSLYAEQGLIAGVGELWRPLSLSPDRTWNALLSLVVPISIVALLTKLDARRRYSLLAVIVGIIGFSIAVVLFRLMTGGSWFGFRFTTDGGGGIFANRNHQALLLAMGFPMLAAWAVEDRMSRVSPRLRWMMAGTGAIFLIVLIPALGSRTGLVLGGAALVMSLTILWGPMLRALRRLRHRNTRRLVIGGIGVVLVSSVFLSLTLSRAEGVRRLVALDVAGDLRALLLPRVLEMTATFSPVGSGFGSFDPVFRRFEQLGDLRQIYFNQAHNDLLQTLTEGGVIGGALLVAALIWFLIRTIRVWRAGTARTSARMARLASSLLALMIGASIVDYPLRTPLMMALFVVFAVWLHEPIPTSENGDQPSS